MIEKILVKKLPRIKYKYIKKQIKILNSSHQIFKYSFESKKRWRQYRSSRKMAALHCFTAKHLKYDSKTNCSVLSHFYLSGHVSHFPPRTFTTPHHAYITFVDLSFSHGALIARLNYISREEDVPPRGASRQNEFTLSFTFVKLVPPRRLN